MKIGFVSLGCPKNLVDSEVMMGLLEARGHELTPYPEEAEALVVNTCSFIDPAKQESVDTILEIAEYKKSGAARRMIVAGCLVERDRDEIRGRIPDVDAVLGTNELDVATTAFDSSSYAVSEIVLSGCLRIFTHHRVFNPPTPLDAASAFVNQVRSQPNAVVIQPGPQHWEIFTTLCRSSNATGNLVPDAYLAALAIESGSELITTDRDFARFPDLKWGHPFE